MDVWLDTNYNWIDNTSLVQIKLQFPNHISNVAQSRNFKVNLPNASGMITVTHATQGKFLSNYITNCTQWLTYWYGCHRQFKKLHDTTLITHNAFSLYQWLLWTPFFKRKPFFAAISLLSLELGRINFSFFFIYICRWVRFRAI